MIFLLSLLVGMNLVLVATPLKKILPHRLGLQAEYLFHLLKRKSLQAVGYYGSLQYVLLNSEIDLSRECLLMGPRLGKFTIDSGELFEQLGASEEDYLELRGLTTEGEETRAIVKYDQQLVIPLNLNLAPPKDVLFAEIEFRDLAFEVSAEVRKWVDVSEALPMILNNILVECDEISAAIADCDEDEDGELILKVLYKNKGIQSFKLN